MDVLKNRYVYLWLSLALAVISIFMLLFWKLNLAIDMTWGINLEYSYENSISIDKIREELEKEKDLLLLNNQKVINNIGVYSITWEKAFSIVAWFDSTIDESVLNWLKTEFKTKTFEVLKGMDSTIVETKYTNIWKSFGDYIRKTAILTLHTQTAVLLALHKLYLWQSDAMLGTWPALGSSRSVCRGLAVRWPGWPQQLPNVFLPHMAAFVHQSP